MNREQMIKELNMYSQNVVLELQKGFFTTIKENGIIVDSNKRENDHSLPLGRFINYKNLNLETIKKIYIEIEGAES